LRREQRTMMPRSRWRMRMQDEDINNPNDKAYMSVLNMLPFGGDTSRFLLGDQWDEDCEGLNDDFHSPINNQQH
jgi:hypothetical protein